MMRVVRAHVRASIAAVLLMSPFIWWTFDPREPVTVLNFGVTPTQVRAGDTLYREITVIRHRNCLTDPDVILIDGARVRFQFDEPPIQAPGPIGIADTYRQAVVIPLQAAPGKAELRVTVARSCNPIQQIWPRVSRQPPVYFEILPH